MKLYHVSVLEDDGWLVGRVLEREGVTTQGRTLDELVFMIRDAISMMWDENSVQLELILPSETAASTSKRARTKTKAATAVPKSHKAAIAQTR